MNKQFIISVIGAFIAIFAFEWVYHGILLMPTYEATASLWRPMDQMEAMMPWCIGTKLAYAVVLTWLFSRHYEAKGIGEGVRFGVMAGLIMGLDGFSGYMYLPITLNLALAWFAGGILKGVIVGIVLSFTYGCCAKKAA